MLSRIWNRKTYIGKIFQAIKSYFALLNPNEGLYSRLNMHKQLNEFTDENITALRLKYLEKRTTIFDIQMNEEKVLIISKNVF